MFDRVVDASKDYDLYGDVTACEEEVLDGQVEDAENGKGTVPKLAVGKWAHILGAVPKLAVGEWTFVVKQSWRVSKASRGRQSRRKRSTRIRSM